MVVGVETVHQLMSQAPAVCLELAGKDPVDVEFVQKTLTQMRAGCYLESLALPVAGPVSAAVSVAGNNPTADTAATAVDTEGTGKLSFDVQDQVEFLAALD